MQQVLPVKLVPQGLRVKQGQQVQRGLRARQARQGQLAQLDQQVKSVPPVQQALQAQLVLPGKAAQQELQRLAEADRAFDCSFDMAVGYGLDAATDDERKADFRAVRGLE